MSNERWLVRNVLVYPLQTARHSHKIDAELYVTLWKDGPDILLGRKYRLQNHIHSIISVL